MIKNERQYKITNSKIAKFHNAIYQFNNEKSDLDPLLRQAQLSAMQYQVSAMEEEVREYEYLKSGSYEVLEVASLADLPKVLIRARIALNLTQKDLAERLGWKEQIVQKYESNNYSSVSFGRLLSITEALDLKIREDVFLPSASRVKNMLKDRLSDIGLNSGFIEKKLLGIKNTSMTTQEWVDEIIGKVTHVFGWEKEALLADSPLVIGKNAAMVARFKMPTIRNHTYVTAYTVYANYIANTTLQCLTTMGQRNELSDNADLVRQTIINDYGDINYENILQYIYSLNIPVVSLNDSGAFHGATWRVNGRNIIVIKQKTKFEAKWAFDVLHELYHATQAPDQLEFSIIEADETSDERRFSAEEIAANNFAAKVLLGEKSESIVRKCFKKASGRIAWLKSAVENVAQEEGADVGILAYQVANEVEKQKIGKWWGAATNLQTKNENLHQDTIGKLLENIDLTILNEKEREIMELIF